MGSLFFTTHIVSTFKKPIVKGEHNYAKVVNTHTITVTLMAKLGVLITISVSDHTNNTPLDSYYISLQSLHLPFLNKETKVKINISLKKLLV